MIIINIPMSKYLKPQETEHFDIIHKEVTEKDVSLMKLRDRINGTEEYSEFKEGTYVVLRDKKKKEIIMSDTWMEWKTNMDFLYVAKGNVLIGGLGIGMTLLSLVQNPNVTSITVIEKEQEIIDMVVPNLDIQNKAKILCGDICTYETDEQFDTIYFDIWNNISTDNFPEMLQLMKKFQKNKKENGWMQCWRFEDCYDSSYIFELKNAFNDEIADEILQNK